MDLKSALLTVGGSACVFRLINSLVKYLPVPELAKSKLWKWRNTVASLTHSSVSATCAVLCIYRHPQMAQDLVNYHSFFSHGLVAVSMGYFIYDFVDNCMNQEFRYSREVLLHHAAVVPCLGLAVVSGLYVGFAVVSLTLEVNSVFIHIRQLLLLAGRRYCRTPPIPSTPGQRGLAGAEVGGSAPGQRGLAGAEVGGSAPGQRGLTGAEVGGSAPGQRGLTGAKVGRSAPGQRGLAVDGAMLTAQRDGADGHSMAYRINSLLNLSTLLVFRVCTIGWMSRWLAAQRFHMPRVVMAMGTVGLALVTVMNAVLLWRLLCSDVFPRSRGSTKSH